MTPPPEHPVDGPGPDRDRSWRAASLDPADPRLLERLGLTIPDDARALDPLRRELLREQRPRRRSRRRSGRTGGSEDQRTALTALGAVLVLFAGTLALTGLLTVVMTPGAVGPRAGGLPLAQGLTALPGEVGGLLPDTGVSVDGVGASARALRPAVLFVPGADGCTDCAAALDGLAAQAREYGVAVHVVAAVDATASAQALLEQARTDTAHLLVDSSGALRATYAAPEARVVLVHADGVVADVRDAPAAGERIETSLVRLPLAGAPPSLRAGAATY